LLLFLPAIAKHLRTLHLTNPVLDMPAVV
jgi:hypothetical protein